MARLLVRNLEPTLVKRLKTQAALHGVSAEEEHRRILREALARPSERKASLIEFLLKDEGALPEVKLNLKRSRKIESHRPVKF